MRSDLKVAGGEWLLVDALEDWLKKMDNYGVGTDQWIPTTEALEQIIRIAHAAITRPEVERNIPASDCIFGKCPGCGAEFAVLKPPLPQGESK